MTSQGQLTEPLLHGQKQEGFNLSIEQLCSLFHPDNIKNYHPEGHGKVSHSLYEYWNQFGGPNGLAEGLRTDLKRGIVGTQQDVKNRNEKFGENRKRLPKIRTLFELILENFEDRILQILLLAATVSLVIGVYKSGWSHGWVEGLSIFIAVFIIVTVTAGNNYIKEKQFQKLVAKAQEDTCAVFRGMEGLTQTIDTKELVVGDLVKIEAGMRIPADSLLVEGTDIATDESAMTGEPEQVEKHAVNAQNVEHNPNPFLLGKTLVVSGQGLAVICAVGVHTRSGMAEEKLNIEEEVTPLQAKLETIANEIGKVGVYVSILTFIAMTVTLIYETVTDDTAQLIHVDTLKELVGYLIIAITVIVVAVPEGLPLAVTISLAYSVMKMKEEKNLVRKLEASETMGGANEICTDKTGTLTKNQMTVKEFYAENKVFVGRQDNFMSMKTAELLYEGILFNCSARIEKNPETGVYEPKGNCTEQGLIRFLQDCGVPAHEIIRKKEDSILQFIPFNSGRKRACTAVRHPDNHNIVRVFVKGAPEIVLNYCDKYFDENGKAVELTERQKEHITKEIVTNSFAKKAYRTLLIAYSDIDMKTYESLKAQHNGFAKEADREVLENNLTAIGIYALQDPLRDEIVDSVKRCHRAGINIRMVTGDNLDTAKAIAIEAGIVTAEEAEMEYVCMEGKQFRELCGGLKKLEDESDRNLLKEEIGNKAQFRQIKDRLKVLARSTPEDKYMLVTGLKEHNAVVAVTGDGTNDAPALKKADVGFAMGITGTEVAKEASDIVLLDDNFASIITAVKWGRNIYTNVRKFLQFQLTVNVVAMFIVFLGGVTGGETVLTSVQMLWVNLIMDTCAALALATEPPSDTLLHDKPYSRNDLIVTPVMWRNIIGQGAFQIIILVVMLYAGKSIFNITYDDDEDYYTYTYDADGNEVIITSNKVFHYTLIFHTFVFLQVFNEINSRKLGAYEYNVFKGFFDNYMFLGIIIGTIIVQCMMVEYGGVSVRTTPLSWEYHAICIGIGALSLIQGVIVKAFLPVRWFEKWQMKEAPMSEEEANNAFNSNFKKSFRQSTRRSIQVKDHKE